MGYLIECFETWADAAEYAHNCCDDGTYDIDEVYQEDGEFCGYGIYVKPEYC